VARFEYPSYDKAHTGHESDSVNDWVYETTG
jgi:hypothetical protein